MAHRRIETAPIVINTIVGDPQTDYPFPKFGTQNTNKLREISEMLGVELEGAQSPDDEIQAPDVLKVAQRKAKDAWELNGCQPTIVEDTSLECRGWNNLPGAYIKDFADTPDNRKKLVDLVHRSGDDVARAKTVLCVYDGLDYQYRIGEDIGRIAPELRGSGWDWDDIFIPDNQPDGQQRTYGQMMSEEKNSMSMRAKAVQALKNKPFNLVDKPIYQLYEPYDSELERMRTEELQDERAKKFAYSLTDIQVAHNQPNPELTAGEYAPVTEQRRGDLLVYAEDPNSADLPLILTPQDLHKIKVGHDGRPELFQMGPDRRKLGIAQRVEYFNAVESSRRQDMIKAVESGMVVVPTRANYRYPSVIAMLGAEHGSPTRTPAFEQIGYTKLSAAQEVSRTDIQDGGLIHTIGKYPRHVFGVGSLPAVSGRSDIVVMAAISDMMVFIPRNNLFIDPERRIRLAKEVIRKIESIYDDPERIDQAKRHIGVAIGTNVKEDMDFVDRWISETGLSFFRVYTINGDPRVIHTAAALRDKYGNTVEMCVGQISDHAQARRLVRSDIRADILGYGHGGGRVCTSGENGMGITTVEQVQEAVTDPELNDTSIVVEGGVGKKVGGPIIMGVDGILYNNQFGRGTLEAGNLFVRDKHTGTPERPYPGSASANTMMIEAQVFPEVSSRRISPSGRTIKPEGKPGFMQYEEKANSMAFWITEFNGHAARVFADLGVRNFAEFREFLRKTDKDLLREVTTESQVKATAYRNGR